MKIQINRVMSLLILLITISYTGIFAGYHGCMALIGSVIILFAAGLSDKFFHVNLKYCSPLWLVLFLYLCLNSLLNMPKSLFYIVLFSGGLLVMLRVMNAKEIICIISLFKAAAVILAVSVLMQAYVPAVFYFLADKWFFYSNQYEVLLHLGIECHQYSGLFYEVSFSALILSLGCIICFVEMIYRKFGRIQNLMFIMAMYYAVILTGKRSFMLIVPVLLAAFWLFSGYRHISLLRVTAVFGFVFILIWQSANIFGIIENVLTKGQGNTIQLSSREQYWKLALDMFQQKRLLGNGLNSFDIAFNLTGIKEAVLDFAGAHNSYLQLLAETGIIGTVLYMSGIFVTIKTGVNEMFSCYKHQNKNKMIYNSIAVLALLLIMIYGITGNVLYQPQQVIMMFLFFNMILNLRMINDSDLNRKQKFKITL